MDVSAPFGDDYTGLGAQNDAELDGKFVGRHCAQATDNRVNGGLDLIKRMLQRFPSPGSDLTWAERRQFEAARQFLLGCLYQQRATAVYRELHQICHKVIITRAGTCVDKTALERANFH
jgi:hypothetical protein